MALVYQLLIKLERFTGDRFKVPSSVLWQGCTPLCRSITAPKSFLGSSYFPLHDCVLEYPSTGAGRSQGTLECLVHTIKGEFWIEYLDGRTRTISEGKKRKLRKITFFIKKNHMGKKGKIT